MIGWIVFYMIGALIGAGLSWYEFDPGKTWDEGYEAAKETYSNWSKGFDAGWYSAIEYMQSREEK